MTTEAIDKPQVQAESGDEEPQAEARSSLVSLTGVVRGTHVAARNALIGGIAADDVTVERGVARMVVAGDRVEMRQAGAQLVLAGGDVSVDRGGAQAVLANGSIRISRGGTGMAIARRIEVGDGGLVVFGVAPSLDVTGGRVLIGPLAVLAIVGSVIAAVLAAAGIRRRRRA